MARSEHKEEISDLALLETGELYSASFDKSIRCFDLETGKCTGRLLGHQELIKCVKAQPTDSGTRIISASWDGLVKIWDRPRKVKRKKKIKDIFKWN
jgi:WD40 repeat protein